MEQDRAWLLPSIAIAGLSALWAASFAIMTGFEARPIGVLSLQITIMVIALAACWRVAAFVQLLWKAGEPNPILQIRKKAWPSIASFLPFVAGVTAIAVFLSSMSYLKSMIVSVVPFWADEPLAAVDRLLHIEPAAVALALQPVIGPLGRFYDLWHWVHLGSILWVLHWRSGMKSQLIIAFMLTWALGMICAYIFSSAGPVFTGDYDPTLAPASVQRTTQFLWKNYTAGTAVLGGGISAFPSMHVAIAAWFAIVLKHRNLLWLGVLYFVGVYACSVILGWHYVIDGVAGGAIALVANWLSQAWLRRGRIEWMGARPVAQASS